MTETSAAGCAPEHEATIQYLYLFAPIHRKAKMYGGVEVQQDTLLFVEVDWSKLSAHSAVALLPWELQLMSWEAGLAQSIFGPARSRSPIIYPIADHCTDWDIPAGTEPTSRTHYINSNSHFSRGFCMNWILLKKKSANSKTFFGDWSNCVLLTWSYIFYKSTFLIWMLWFS
jgi:hypothetical protein